MRILFLLPAFLALLLGPTCTSAGEPKKQIRLTISQRSAEPLLKSDRPWEDYCICYCQVLRHNDRWLLWYNSYGKRHEEVDNCCYAESTDGVHWQKPSLGLVPWDSDKNNNILFQGYEVGSIVIDDQAPPAERFKMVGTHRAPIKKPEFWVYGATSPDGIHWRWAPEPLVKKNSDTLNVCFRDGDTYRLYLRMWTGGDFKGHRVIGYSESTGFPAAFSDPMAILAPTADDPSDLHFYSSATTKIRDGLYLMLFSGFTTGDQNVRIYAAISRDGKHFDRLGNKPIMDVGQGFDSRGLYVGPGLLPGERPGTYWFYYIGHSAGHDDIHPKKVDKIGGLGRFLLTIGE